MKFSFESRDIVIDRTGKLFEQLLDGKMDKIALLFTPTNIALFDNKDNYIQYVSILENEETGKRIDESFLNVIHKAALKDKFEKIMVFLVSINDDISKAYDILQAIAWKWITDYLCDDKNHFRHLAAFTAISMQLGEIIEKLFLKLTNTRKHGKVKRIIDGKAAMHDLYEYSPINPKNLQLDLFDIEVYGEACVKVGNKYHQIILLIAEVYHFSIHIDRVAQQVKANPQTSKEYLYEMLEEFKNERLKAKNRTSLEFYPGEVEDAKRHLPPDVVDKIANASLEDIYMLFYHEIKHAMRDDFSILLWTRLLSQQELTDVEYAEVFAHIENEEERHRKAKGARILYAHWNEFAKNMVEKETGTNGGPLDKGKMAFLMMKWTGTEMSQNSFVKEYHNKMCVSEGYQVSVNTLNYARNSNKVDEAMERRFSIKAQEIIDKYSLTVDVPISIVNKPNAPALSEIPAGLMTGEKTQLVGIQNVSQF